MFVFKSVIYIFFFKVCACYIDYVFSDVHYEYRDSDLFLRVNLSNYLQNTTVFKPEGISSPCIDYEFNERLYDIEFWIHDYYDGFNEDYKGTYCFLKDAEYGKKMNMNVRTYQGKKVIWSIDIVEPYGKPSAVRKIRFDKDYLNWNTPKEKNGPKPLYDIKVNCNRTIFKDVNPPLKLDLGHECRKAYLFAFHRIRINDVQVDLQGPEVLVDLVSYLYFHKGEYNVILFYIFIIIQD